MPIRCDTCLHKNMHVGVHPSVLDALTTPQLLPSAQLQQANYSRQSLLSPHSFLPSSPFVPLPTAAHTAQSQISYSLAQRAAYERERVKRREGIQEPLMGSLLALMEIVSFQFGPLMIFC